MRFQKLILSSILLLLSFFIFENVYAIKSPTDKFYVNDYADILNEETEKYIFENSVKLNEKTTVQIVVVTVKDLEGKSIEEYSTELFRKYGIGDKEKNNGLLLLLALKERKSRVEVGYGLEGLLPDGKTGRIQDEYMIPYFKNNNFDEGMLNGYKAFFKEIANEYNYKTEIKVKEEDFQIPELLLTAKFFLFFIVLSINIENPKTKKIVFIILETITIIITYLSYNTSNDSSSLMFLITGSIANLIAVNVTAGNFISGGFGGYSGSSSGSSFHGDGGSSGGGGSSRGF